jgi:hypothetical protein
MVLADTAKAKCEYLCCRQGASSVPHKTGDNAAKQHGAN